MVIAAKQAKKGEVTKVDYQCAGAHGYIIDYGHEGDYSHVIAPIQRLKNGADFILRAAVMANPFPKLGRWPSGMKKCDFHLVRLGTAFQDIEAARKALVAKGHHDLGDFISLVTITPGLLLLELMGTEPKIIAPHPDSEALMLGSRVVPYTYNWDRIAFCSATDKIASNVWYLVRSRVEPVES